MSSEYLPLWDRNATLTNEVVGAVTDFRGATFNPSAICAIQQARRYCSDVIGNDFSSDELQSSLAQIDPEQLTSALQLEEVLQKLHRRIVSFTAFHNNNKEHYVEQVQDHLVTLNKLGVWQILLQLSEPHSAQPQDDQHPDTWHTRPISGMADFRVVDLAQLALEQEQIASTTYDYDVASLHVN